MLVIALHLHHGLAAEQSLRADEEDEDDHQIGGDLDRIARALGAEPGPAGEAFLSLARSETAQLREAGGETA
ncbi:hypothetical protein [Mangrovicoccus ximenensis]|uniref:hypothetical protein n=1 Tax=Mangrovicoccus ximenensis TaxID=1911570 RepID=UPI00191BF335|nr:hypothetical protein [Mangrovicoccus ximenensis]